MDASTPSVDVPAAGGRVVRVRQFGAADGSPVLVHHGTPGSGVQSPAVARAAEAAGLRLVCYDRAGYGGSTAAPGRDVAAVAADMAAVADSLGLARLATWGYSGGGPHALATAALLEERVTRAAVWCSVAPHDAAGLDFLAGMADGNVEEFSLAREGRATLEPVLRAEAASLAGRDADSVIAMLTPFCSPTDAEALRARADALFAEILTAVEAGAGGWVDDDLAFTRSWGFDHGAIRVPVRLWQGGEDRFVPAAHARWLAAHVPGADLRLLPAEGHLSLWLNELDATFAWLAGA
jgi:pimeloyl-ACP methyl ester carboxylesterase